MSRYSSLCRAIDLIEVIKRMMKDNGTGGDSMDAIVQDLQDIAKDSRYGGKWEGNYQEVAEALDCCEDAGSKCNICPYSGMRNKHCIKTLKHDAAGAIRQMSNSLREWQRKNVEEATKEKQQDLLDFLMEQGREGA